MTLSDAQHMALALQALFTFDRDNRMLRVNEPDGDVAPRFFLGRTTAGNVWRFRQDVPDEAARALDALCKRELIVANIAELRQPPTHLDEYTRVLTMHAPIHSSYSGPEYRFPDRIDCAGSAPAERLMPADAERLRPHFSWMIDVLHDMPPAWGVAQEGRVVSVCFSSRTTSQADEAGVFTVEGFRGRGYAPACVAAWAASIRALGRTPLYGTTWDNIASQRVARRLGLIPFGAVLHVG